MFATSHPLKKCLEQNCSSISQELTETYKEGIIFEQILTCLFTLFSTSYIRHPTNSLPFAEPKDMELVS